MPIRFTPIKFPLKMRGVDIRNLEDLRKNFDLNAAIEYFRNGKLIQWLKARYLSDAAEKISALNENASDFREKICAALGATCDEKFFRNDGGIVYEKLIWDDEEISPPEVADEKEYQPVNQSSPRSELTDIFETIFGKRGVWDIIDLDGEPTPVQKKMFLKMICGGEYSERDLIYLQADQGFTRGWAFTTDSFCLGGKFELTSGMYHCKKIFYKDFQEMWNDYTIVENGTCWTLDNLYLLGGDTMQKIGKFLEFAKD